VRFSDDEIRRYGRQMVLAEVGGWGQERLHAARATAASELEALYLAAAGLGHIEVSSPAIAAAVTALNPNVIVTVSAKQPDSGVEIGAETAALAALETLKTVLSL
jgi:molybdopterin/thiamine biosynthesis adenylyltransferase